MIIILKNQEFYDNFIEINQLSMMPVLLLILLVMILVGLLNLNKK